MDHRCKCSEKLRSSDVTAGAAQQGWTLESITVYTEDGVETLS